ncbi:hypothetical protein PsAD2_04552 [Pseudovibrio axinellae]|uniref:Uncharacterized protein n=1 Tax=Pseudovibrio axinellae TaxID=989403 RepID=A0A165SXW5_9HYPH|nr:hypothetical protein PsAD2_04552 [Pseudovibrio axinellae]SER64336.1 hypothetical protein SAMN05421798_1155 [Pseudovibrio axinellae]
MVARPNAADNALCNDNRRMSEDTKGADKAKLLMGASKPIR